MTSISPRVIAALTLASAPCLLLAQATDTPKATPWQAARAAVLPYGAIKKLGGTLGLRHVDNINNAVFSPDGKLLATTGHTAGSLFLWDVQTGAELLPFPWADSHEVWSMLAFAHDGKRAAVFGTTTPWTAPTNRLALWELGDVPRVKYLDKLPNIPQNFGANNPWEPLVGAFTPKDDLLVTVTAGAEVTWWNLTTGEIRASWDLMENLRKKKGADAPIILIRQAFISNDAKLFAGVVYNGLFVPQNGNTASYYVVVWDLESRKPVSSFPFDSERPLFAFSPDGKHLAIYHNKEAVLLFDTLTGKELARYPARNRWLSALAVSHDGKSVAIGEARKGVTLWSVDKAKANLVLKQPASDNPAGLGNVCLAFAPDGKKLVFSYESAAQLYDTATGKELLPEAGHIFPVTHLRFSADSKEIISGHGSDWEFPHHAIRWSIADGKALETLAIGPSTQEKPIPTSPDLKQFLQWADDGQLKIIDRASGKAVKTLAGGQVKVASSWMGFFSPDNRLLVLERKMRGKPGVVQIFDAQTGKLLSNVPDVQFLPRSAMAISADNRWLAWDGLDGSVRLVEIATGKGARYLRPEPAVEVNLTGYGAVAFSPNGRYLAAWNYQDRHIRCWSLPDGREQWRLPMGERNVRNYHVSAMAWSPDSRMLAISPLDSRLQLIEAATGKVRRDWHWYSPKGDVRALAFSPDGKFLASGGHNAAILVWDVHAVLTLPRNDLDELSGYWTDLGDPNAAVAGEALGKMIKAKNAAVVFLRDHVKPKPVADAKLLAKWIADLGSESFTVRDKASRGLANSGEAAEGHLRKALADSPSEEVRRRAESLLNQLQERSRGSKQYWAELRAVEALEYIATPEARDLLLRLSAGDSGAQLTAESRSALQRLDKVQR